MTEQEIQAYAALAHDIFYAGGNQDDAAKICKALRELFHESQQPNRHIKG